MLIPVSLAALIRSRWAWFLADSFTPADGSLRNVLRSEDKTLEISVFCKADVFEASERAGDGFRTTVVLPVSFGATGLKLDLAFNGESLRTLLSIGGARSCNTTLGRSLAHRLGDFEKVFSGWP